MTEKPESVKKEVRQLSESDKARRARFVIESHDASEDSDAEAAWDAELSRRVEQIEQETSRLRPALQVLAELRDKFNGKPRCQNWLKN